jgi:zinc protease
MDGSQSVARFGLMGPSIDDPDYIAAQVVAHIAGGGGMTSKLMEEVRSKRGLAYSVATDLEASRHASIFRGHVATRNDRLGNALDVICDVLRKMSDGDLDDRDLDDAKSYLIGSYPLNFDSNAKICNQLLGHRIDGFGPDYSEARKAMIAAVTLDDLKRVAKRMLRVDDLIVSIAGGGRW